MAEIEIFLRRGAKRELVGNYPVQPGVTTVGRKTDNTICLEDRRVSEVHAEIHFDGTVWTVRDRSSNGVLLAGQKLEPGAATPWNFDQTLSIIEYELELRPGIVEPTEPLFTPPDFDVTLALSLEQSNIELLPGKSITVKFTITNESDHVVSRWAPQVSGLPREWCAIRYEKWPEEQASDANGDKQDRQKPAPISATTGIGVQQRSEKPYNQRLCYLTITLPPWEADLATTKANLAGAAWAGERKAVLKIVQLNTGKVLATTHFVVTVLPTYKLDCNASSKKFRRRVPFGLTLINKGNTPDAYTVSWSDPENGLLRFEPQNETIRLGIGEQLTQTPVIRTQHRHWFGKPQEHKLAVKVRQTQENNYGESLERTQENNYDENLTFVNPAIIPRWVLVLPVILLLLVLWMLRPTAQLDAAEIGADDALPEFASALDGSALAEVCLREPRRIATVELLTSTGNKFPLARMKEGNCWYASVDKKSSSVEIWAGNWLYHSAKVPIPFLTYRTFVLSQDDGDIAYADPTATPVEAPTAVLDPNILSFRIYPQRIILGAADSGVEICWKVEHADAITLDGRNLDNLEDCTSLRELGRETPTKNTEYTLKANGPDGRETSKKVTLNVEAIRCSVASPTVNIRSGPGDNYPSNGSLGQGKEFVAIARNPRAPNSNQAYDFWLKIKDSNGWIAEKLVNCRGGKVASLSSEENVGPPPPPDPTATHTPTETPVPPTTTPAPTAQPEIIYTPNNDQKISVGESLTVNWFIRNSSGICGVFIEYNDDYYAKQKNDAQVFTAGSNHPTSPDEGILLSKSRNVIDLLFIQRPVQGCPGPDELRNMAKNEPGAVTRKTIVISVD
ncbi:MAG: FHA domain-containing protein [Caldilineaceae bacterium]|nr:FHA domain-containing protein [Caldilineaceae bacterium]